MIDFWRQLDLIRPEDLSFPIALIGVGGIGSSLALALAKMGCGDLTLYDPDVVEAHNVPNQLYRPSDIGLPKVTALREILQMFMPVEVDTHQEAVGDQRLRGVVISGVDSMQARERIWRGSVRFRAAIPLYIDARMGAQVCRILTLCPTDPDDVRWYESTLYSDEAATEDPCTAQSIVYTTFGLASLIANQVKKYATGEGVVRDILFDFVTLSLLEG